MLKHCYLILFQLKTILLFLHAEIGVRNTNVYSYFEWINDRIEPICEEELDMTIYLINIKIELNSHHKEFDEWIKIIALHWLN